MAEKVLWIAQNFLCDALYHNKPVNISYGRDLLVLLSGIGSLFIIVLLLQAFSSVAMLLIIRGTTTLTSRPLSIKNNTAAKAPATNV